MVIPMIVPPLRAQFGQKLSHGVSLVDVTTPAIHTPGIKEI
jgi:hypothetical protein